jgi:hypothetical protein
MRRLLLFVLLVVSTGNLFAAKKGDADRIGRSRHFIVSAGSAALRQPGVEVAANLSGGRLLVRVAPGVAVDAAFERLTPEKKIHRRALRTGGKAFADVNVLFHDGVDFESAKEAINAAGGTVADALQLDFGFPNRIAARVAPGQLLDLAADERVLIIDGRRKFRAALENLNTARLHQVDVIRAAPYNLSGAGVVLSFFEFAPAFAHNEFGGRLTTHLTGGGSGDAEHATHVAGTMIAGGALGGLSESARGMAPAATLHQFDARDDDIFELKSKLALTYDVIADNNSWGYVLGWCTAPSCTEGWVWDDTEEYYGYYDPTYVAPIDRIVRSAGVLFVHSAGNDAEKRGPLAAPFTHRHTDDNGDLIPGTYCYSQNGSGTDCPATNASGAPLCGTGPQFCETVRHPQIIEELPAPYGSIGMTASAKNSVAVGAIGSDRYLAGFSSHGPARDGRVKPDVVARGVQVYSTLPNNNYGSKQGTSMAAPAVTGIVALLTEQWKRTYNGARPTPATLKTLLIAGTEDLGNTGPDYQYGFGMVNAKNSADLIIADGGAGRRVKRGSLPNLGSYETTFTVGSAQNVRVVLGWSDPEVVILPSDPIDTSALANDLDVKVITPGGETVLPYVLDRTHPTVAATRGVNNVDNTEVIEIANAGPGTYRVVVTGTRVTAESPQAFVVVANADLEANAAPCVEINEPNGTESTAQFLPQATATSGALCAGDDVDYFTFSANKPGTVSLTIHSTGTPLRVTVSGPAALASVELGTSETRMLNLPFNSATNTTFFVRVEPTGAIGVETGYSIEASYPFDPGLRRRAVRR